MNRLRMLSSRTASYLAVWGGLSAQLGVCGAICLALSTARIKLH